MLFLKGKNWKENGCNNRKHMWVKVFRGRSYIFLHFSQYLSSNECRLDAAEVIWGGTSAVYCAAFACFCSAHLKYLATYQSGNPKVATALTDLTRTCSPDTQVHAGVTSHPVSCLQQEAPSTWRAERSSDTAETSARSSTGWRGRSSLRIWMRSGFRRVTSSKTPDIRPELIFGLNANC